MSLFNRRLFLKLTTKTAAGLALATSLIGCSKEKVLDNSIKMGVTSRPRMLDPRRATDALSSRINRLLYQQLIDFDESFMPVPALANWQQLSLTHYRFSLIKENIFSHGKPLTAVDVVATYNSVLDKDFASPHRGSLNHIKKIVAINDTDIDFYLSKADALFVGRLVIGILPADLIAKDHSFIKNPIGSGGCKVISSSEQKLVLQRKDKVYLEFITVRDATVRVLKLKNAELDIVQNDLSPELLSYAKQHNNKFKVISNKGTNFSYIGFNFEDPKLANINLRKAIAHAIDRQKIIDKLFSGHARLAGGLLVPEHWAGTAELTGFEFDLKKAKKYLNLFKQQQAEGGNVELSFKTSADPTRIRLATVYQSQLKQIGINLNIQSYDWGTFFSDIKQGRFQLFGLSWVGIKSPDIFQYVFHSQAMPPKGANRGRYNDPIADGLINKAIKSTSIQEQADLYKQLQKRLQETLAVIPLWYEDQYAVMRLELEGYKLYSDGRFDGLLVATKNNTRPLHNL